MKLYDIIIIKKKKIYTYRFFKRFLNLFDTLPKYLVEHVRLQQWFHNAPVYRALIVYK